MSAGWTGLKALRKARKVGYVTRVPVRAIRFAADPATRPAVVRSRSLEDLIHHPSMHIGQAEVAALEFVGQAFVVDPHLVQDGRLQVVDVDGVFHGVHAEFIALAVRHAVRGGPVAALSVWVTEQQEELRGVRFTL